MADFYPAAQQIQPPDIYGSYLRGQMAPLQQASAQQSVEQGGLQLSQLRLALQNAQTYRDVATNALQQQGALPGTQNTQSGGASSGGIQNGPQGQVSSPGTVSGMQPSTLMALEYLKPGGGDPLKTAAGIQDYQLKQHQLQVQGPMALADTVASSPNADVLIRNNPGLIQQWIGIAPKLGLDPFKDLNPQNARKAAIYSYNNLAGSAGLPTKPMPDELRNVDLGQGEIGQVSATTGKKMGDLVERQTPSYTLVDKYDPATNTTNKVPVQTGGYGMGGVSPSTGASVGTTPPGGPPGFNSGMKAPTDPEFKAAMFASEMRSGMNTMQKLEGQGFNLSPKTRAMVINAATSEDSGALAQLLSQEGLVHLMNKQEQTYVSALMPMLQAAGHDQSGARLTTAQIRQNVESLLPVDVNNQDALKQVQENRQGFYTGLLTQAGSAAQLPQYKNTLGADLTQAQQKATGQQKVLNGRTYVKRGGKWYAN